MNERKGIMHENRKKTLGFLYVNSVGRLAKPVCACLFRRAIRLDDRCDLLRRTIWLDDRCVGVGAIA